MTLDLGYGLYTVAVGHNQVHQDDIWLQAFGLSHCVLAVFGFANYLDAGIGFQEHLDTSAHHGVIIYYQDTSLIHVYLSPIVLGSSWLIVSLPN
jgi:hypothetical protein